MTPEDLRETGIFQPYFLKEYLEAKQFGRRFVHYCSADVALSIIRSKEIWMRNVTAMNDYSEVIHGLDLLAVCYSGPLGQKFKAAINKIRPSASQELEERFNGWVDSLTRRTFITCFSLHDDDEDLIGRLSMWRAYGRGVGVALVIRNDAMLAESDALNAWSTPVAYLREDSFAEMFKEVTEAIATNADFISERIEDRLVDRLFSTFSFAILSTKHPGFAEEKEWRVIHSPDLYPSDVLRREVVSIGGAPQLVFKIPLADVPEKGLLGLNPEHLLERLIIGPSDQAHLIAEALIVELDKAGISDPAKRVVISDIPLRS